MTTLLAIGDFAVRISPDGLSLVIDARHPLGRMTVPVPLHDVAAIGVRDQPVAGARYTISSGLTAPYWIEIVFGAGPPWQVGPLSATDASNLVLAFDAWRSAHPLDREIVDVTEEQLVADPTRWHQRRIRVTGTWRNQFESSRFANVWLDQPEGSSIGSGTYRATIVGTWLYPDATNEHGFGHMGMSPGELRAETIDILATADRRLDGLTQLVHRAAFHVELPRARLASADAGAPIAFALLDLDRFKFYNDEHGHQAGDRVLQEFARIVREAMADDVVARWAGDVIAVAMPKTSGPDAHARVEQVLATMREHGPLTFSAGVVEIQPGETLDQVVKRADELLYAAKKRGRNCVLSG